MRALQGFLLFHALTCLGQNALGSEIIKGRKAEEKEMLYMASVQDDSGHICGGFLVSEYFVMTAAHCAERNPTSVVLGTHNLKKVEAKMRYSVQMCKHHSYKNIISGNDIMLLKLSRKARLDGNKLIKAIKLPRRNINLKENRSCSVAGWGAVRSKGENVDELQVVEVPIIDMKRCQALWHDMLPANVICAGGYFKKQGICQGDSGGPLVCDKVAVGVVSFNNQNTCDYPDVPNIYTEISKFLSWIKPILKKKKCQV